MSLLLVLLLLNINIELQINCDTICHQSLALVHIYSLLMIAMKLNMMSCFEDAFTTVLISKLGLGIWI